MVEFINDVWELKRSARAFGWHGGDNGAFLASTLVLSISALSYKNHEKIKLLALITIPITGLALILTQTRAWIVALLLVLGLMFFLQKRGSIRKLLITLGLLFGFFIIVLQTDAFGLVDSKFFLGAIQGASRFGKAPGVYSMEDVSLFLRFRSWAKAIELYISHPFIGFGIGNVRIADYYAMRIGKAGEGVGYVDNQYLQIFAEAGTIAGIALIVYIIHSIKIGLKSFRESCFRP